MKSWLKKNDTEMYSAHNDGKSVVAERFIRTLKNIICKYMILISKKVYIDKLDDIVNEYSNRYYRTIKKNVWCKIKRIYIDSSKEINGKDPKFKIGDIVRISKYKNIFGKRYVANLSEEVSVIKKV